MLQEKFDPLVAEWISFVRSPDFNTAEKCLKMAQLLEYPEMNVNEYVQKISRIGKSLREYARDVRNPIYKISVLNEHLFGNLCFVGNREDYYNPMNNFLNEVIDRKVGIPITIAVLYVEVAKFVGLDLKIVGFPGHVLVKHGEEMILDPFNNGQLLGIDQIQDMLDDIFAGHLEFEPRFLDDASQEDVLIRLARNLKNSYAQSYAYEKALRCTNMILAIKPISPEDIRDKGILEERMLNHDVALVHLSKYLETSPDAEDADFVLELIRSIRATN